MVAGRGAVGVAGGDGEPVQGRYHRARRRRDDVVAVLVVARGARTVVPVQIAAQGRGVKQEVTLVRRFAGAGREAQA